MNDKETSAQDYANSYSKREGYAHPLPEMSLKQVAEAMGMDMINHPPHYTNHPSGIECIQITEHMGFNLGNAVKYIWRADLKGSSIQDLEKSIWYVKREIEKRKNESI